MFTEYAWLIPALPALAAAIIALWGLRTPEKGGWIAVLLVGFAAAVSLGVFYENLHHVTFDAPIVTSFNWFTTGALVLNMGVYIDPLTIFMLFTVGILVTLIALYSVGYMHEEGTGRRRYFAELTLFITGMLGLVVSSNYLMLFVFWEIMGLCSYLLIGYWYHKPSAASAAKKAFLTTRVGDAFFLVGLGILFVSFKSLDFTTIFEAAARGAPGVDRNILLLANSCVFIGAVGKSAQFPLHTWLPDAMEGPTTVSALIHAATMVKAGVYLVARSYPLFVLTPKLLIAVAVVGGFTALFAATLALTNWDLKRVLAYSTLSQLGYMFLGLGVAGALFWAEGAEGAALAAVALTGVTVAIFHLFSHAFFKAGLFLSAGSVGHSFHGAANPYDMRQMGGLRKYMPITAFAMLMGTISIAGIPPFSGFFSKDAIVGAVWEAARETGSILYYALFAAAILTAGLTAYYMFRLYFLTFTGEHRGVAWWRSRSGASDVPESHTHHPEPEHHGHVGPSGPGAHAHDAHEHAAHGEHHAHDAQPHEGPWTMTAPLAILGVFAIVGGILALLFAGGAFGHLIGPSEGVVASVGAGEEHLADGLVAALIHPFTEITTYITLVAAGIGIALAYMWWGPGKAVANITRDDEATGIARVWQKRYYIDQAYDRVFGYAVLKQAEAQNAFDSDVIDGAVNGVATVSDRSGERLRRWNTGFVQDYALTALFGLMVIMLIVIYAPQIPGLWAQARGMLGGS
ncbi:MAG TPA: proton-conducting transporter membrane subunit [Candidatus Thermoplasmatota archaeon]|nr:proton-conducting transporter membrane subunit [Candidatus Thermoplasmatota archaeon]